MTRGDLYEARADYKLNDNWRGHVVGEYLAECARRGLGEVRLIHGRGTGTQRAIVRSLLTNHPLVLAFFDAPPERGGWGATIVRLRETTPTE